MFERLVRLRIFVYCQAPIGRSELDEDIVVSQIGTWMVTLDHWSDPGLLVGYVIVVVFANANDVGSIYCFLIDDAAVPDEAH